MKLNFKSPISVAIAISFGLLVLMGYFFGTSAAGQPTMLGILRDYLLKGAVVMAAMALIVGIVNLASVHIKKIQTTDSAPYSFLLLSAMIATLAVGLWDIIRSYVFSEPNFQRVQWIFENIQIPVETSLMAVLTISLTYAAARLFRKRLTLFSAIFIATLLVTLLGAIPQLSNRLPFLGDLHSWIIDVPTVGGARGILLGVALGTIATGIRILIGSDRPYKG